jgi:hypothetical protein
MKTYIVVIVSVITSLAFTNLTHAEGEIYRYKNSQGNTVYSDRKPNTEYELITGSSKKSNAQPIETKESKKAPLAVRSVKEVSAITDTIKPDIDALYTKLVSKDREAQGKVAINFTIAQAGNITSCAEDETKMKSSKFNGAICGQINKLQFKPVENPDLVSLTFTYNFNPAR